MRDVELLQVTSYSPVASPETIEILDDSIDKESEEQVQMTLTTTEVTECAVESNLSSVQFSSESDTEMPVNLEPSDLGEQVQTLSTVAGTAQSSLTTELAVDQTVNDLGACTYVNNYMLQGVCEVSSQAVNLHLFRQRSC